MFAIAQDREKNIKTARRPNLDMARKKLFYHIATKREKELSV